MGKTHRNLGYSYNRRPKGAKQAKAAQARSVPPSAWDDQGYAAAGEFYQPMKRYLAASVGKHWDEVQAHILHKWGERMVREARSWLSRGPFRKWPYLNDQLIICME